MTLHARYGLPPPPASRTLLPGAHLCRAELVNALLFAPYSFTRAPHPPPTSSSVYPLLTPVARCLNHTWTRHSLHSSMHMRYPIQAGHATNRVGSCPQAQHGWYRLHLAARGWPIPLAVAGGSPELDPARLTRHRGMGAAQSLATSRTCPAAHRRFPGTREFGAPAGARMCECRQREEV